VSNSNSLIENPIKWPNGAKCAASITFDMDADSLVHLAHPEDSHTRVAAISMLRYGPEIAIPRIVKTWEILGIKQTFYVPAWCIEHYPKAIDVILKGGHEIGHHGYIHEHPRELSKEEEAYWLDRGIEVITKATGMKPKGWRAPLYNFSNNSADLLIERGFTYDASLMGDDIPYFLDTEKGSLVEIPSHWGLDDWPQYVHAGDLNYVMQVRSPKAGFQIYIEEFETAYRHGGLWVPVVHPFATGRLSRWEVVSKFLTEVREKGDVWFASMNEIADYVREVTNNGEYKPRRDKLPYYRKPSRPEPSFKSKV